MAAVDAAHLLLFLLLMLTSLSVHFRVCKLHHQNINLTELDSDAWLCRWIHPPLDRSMPPSSCPAWGPPESLSEGESLRFLSLSLLLCLEFFSPMLQLRYTERLM
jgi:hypothetical protein